MKLQDESGGSFELQILRYEFPDFTEDLWDANWLVVKGTVTAPDGSWEFIDSCVTTFELHGLADWLDTAASTAFRSSEHAFVEPNLKFVCSSNSTPCVEIKFAHESAPPWLNDEHRRTAGLKLQIPITLERAREAATSLRAMLMNFPTRGGAA